MGVDTAENEPSRKSDVPGRPPGPQDFVSGPLSAKQPAAEVRRRRSPEVPRVHDTSLFPRLVLGGIDSYDSESRRIFQGFSRPTR